MFQHNQIKELSKNNKNLLDDLKNKQKELKLNNNHILNLESVNSVLNNQNNNFNHKIDSTEEKLNKLAITKKTEIKNLNTLIHDKESKLKSSHGDIDKLNHQLQNLAETRNNEIEKLNTLIHSKNSKLESLQDDVIKLNHQLQNLAGTKKNVIEKSNILIHENECKLNKIEESINSYKKANETFKHNNKKLIQSIEIQTGKNKLLKNNLKNLNKKFKTLFNQHKLFTENTSTTLEAFKLLAEESRNIAKFEKEQANEEKQRIKSKLIEIKSNAIATINNFTVSWEQKINLKNNKLKRSINNFNMFSQIQNCYLGTGRTNRKVLFNEIKSLSNGFSKYFTLFKANILLKKSELLEQDLKKIEYKLNRVPFQFIESFNESKYLYSNPDIKKGIDEEQFLSGLEHFIFFGYDEVLNGGRKLDENIPTFSINKNNHNKEILHLEFQRYLANCYTENKSTSLEAPTNALNELDYLVNSTRPIEVQSIDDDNDENIVLNNDNILLQEAIVEEKLNHKKNYNYTNLICDESIINKMRVFKKNPLISIIMPVYNVEPKWLHLAIQSVTKQWYPNWELCIVDDKSTNIETIDFLKSINNKKINIKFLKSNGNISIASNKALKMVNGDFIALMDNDDELTANALYEVVKSINEFDAEFIYSDEDKLEMDGTFSSPHFKADYSPDMFLSQNYLSHLGVIKTKLVMKANGFTIGLEGSQDYDLYLKVLELTKKVHHIPKVLYHWRMIPGSTAAAFSDKSYAQNAGVKALQNAMNRRKIKAEVSDGKYPGTYKINYQIKGDPLVSIIIPFKDMPHLLTMCIESIINKSTYQNFEIIGINNNSSEQATFEEMNRLEVVDSRIKFYEYNVPFNYSQINNYAVNTHAKGEHILLLNNDIEIITPKWIEEMLMHSQRKGIGCVGAKLYYPNETIQHAGVVVGIGGVAGHSHKYFNKNSPGYFTRLDIVQNYSAVTAACLMVKKNIYNKVGGLNQDNLKVAFNDIDFCLRVQEKGYLNLFTPYCEAYHHESISRGHEDTEEKQNRFNKEVTYMMDRHENILKNGDPFYNINLTLEHENFETKT